VKASNVTRFVAHFALPRRHVWLKECHWREQLCPPIRYCCERYFLFFCFE
jgi:hypothetical protein